MVSGGGGSVEDEHVGGCWLWLSSCSIVRIGLDVVIGVHEIKGLQSIRGLGF